MAQDADDQKSYKNFHIDSLTREQSKIGVRLLRQFVSVAQSSRQLSTIITSCPIYHHPNGSRALSDVRRTWRPG